MNQPHPFRDDLPAHALGALDSDEAAALEKHLSECPICRSELAEYRKVGEMLLVTTPPQSPPPRVRGQLAARLPRRRKGVPALPAWSPFQIGLGLALAVLLVLNLFTFSRLQALQREQASLAQQLSTGQTALVMLAYSGTKNIPIYAGEVSGSFLYDPERSTAVLVMWNLPALEESQTYQAWLIDPEGQRTSAGIFEAEAGPAYTSLRVSAPGVLSHWAGLGVTVEPAGGSPQPTGERVFKIDF